jgi:hypothetical protein
MGFHFFRIALNLRTLGTLVVDHDHTRSGVHAQDRKLRRVTETIGDRGTDTFSAPKCTSWYVKIKEAQHHRN